MQFYVIRAIIYKDESGYSAAFGIDVDGEVVGVFSVGLKSLHKASLGYWLGEPFWGRGIMTEALNKISKFGFNVLKLKRIEASVYPHNEASAAVLLANGFEKEGYLRKSEIHWGKYMDVILFAKVK